MAITIEELKKKVVDFRSNGQTFSEISKVTNVPVGTISKWLRGVTFSEEILQKIKTHSIEKRARGLTQSKLSKDIKKKFRERGSLIEAKKVFEKFKKDPPFISGIVLYWSHGSFRNKYFQFTNSDEEKIRFILRWLKEYEKLEPKNLKYRLFCKKEGVSSALEHWEKQIGIKTNIALTFSSQKSSKSIKNKGVLQILHYNLFLAQKMLFWKKLWLEEYRK